MTEIALRSYRVHTVNIIYRNGEISVLDLLWWIFGINVRQRRVGHSTNIVYILDVRRRILVVVSLTIIHPYTYTHQFPS